MFASLTIVERELNKITKLLRLAVTNYVPLQKHSQMIIKTELNKLFDEWEKIHFPTIKENLLKMV